MMLATLNTGSHIILKHFFLKPGLGCRDKLRQAATSCDKLRQAATSCAAMLRVQSVLLPFVLLSAPKVEQGCQMAYFQTKIPIWVNFGGSCNGKCWYILWLYRLCILWLIGKILWPFGEFHGYLVYISPLWYVVPRKIWQP
jgi:hypothetical protein